MMSSVDSWAGLVSSYNRGEMSLQAILEEAQRWGYNEADRHGDEIDLKIKQARDAGYEEAIAAYQASSGIAQECETPDARDAAQPINQSSRSAPDHEWEQLLRRPMRIMRIHFMDRSHMDYESEQIHYSGGWSFSVINGVENLVIGHGLPRTHIPVHNIKTIELLTENEM